MYFDNNGQLKILILNQFKMEVEFKKLVPDTKYDNMFKAVVEINGDVFESRAVKRQNQWNLKAQFPNGFESWHETHFEVVQRITFMEDNPEANVVSEIEYTGGTGALYELAKDLTDEFEKIHEGKEWGIDDDTQYFDAIEEFLNEKLK